MDHTNDILGVKFTLPDRPNVLVVISYDSKLLELSSAPLLIGLWEAAKVVLDGWECEAFPDFRADLSKVEDPQVASIVEYTGGRVRAWRRSLDMIPKN